MLQSDLKFSSAAQKMRFFNAALKDSDSLARPFGYYLCGKQTPCLIQAVNKMIKYYLFYD